MSATILAALFGLIGIALGGGVRAWEAKLAREREGRAVLSALCAEVEAINRLANHRRYLEGFHHYRAVNAELVAAGKGDAPGHWLILELKENYFSTFEALNSKLGLLNPYFADRIARFYTYAKAVMENYRAGSPFHSDLTAAAAVKAFDNDILLLQTVHILGIHIATFRNVEAPPGIIDPFPQIAAASQAVAGDSSIDVHEPAPPEIR